MGIGHAVGGYSLAIATQQTIIEMVAVSKERYPGFDELTAAMSAAAYNSMGGITYLVFPIFGTGITKLLGFRLCLDILTLIDLAFLLGYLVFAEGFSSIKNSCKKLAKLA